MIWSDLATALRALCGLIAAGAVIAGAIAGWGQYETWRTKRATVYDPKRDGNGRQR